MKVALTPQPAQAHQPTTPSGDLQGRKAVPVSPNDIKTGSFEGAFILSVLFNTMAVLVVTASIALGCLGAAIASFTGASLSTVAIVSTVGLATPAALLLLRALQKAWVKAII
jgi:hypothetical protein